MKQSKFDAMTEVQNAKFDSKFIQVGIVKDNRDPQKMGRLKVWIEGSQSNKNTKSSWITCNYASPFAGRTKGSVSSDSYSDHPKSYGFWAVPPDVETRVMVFFINGQIEKAYWFSATYDYGMNGMVPGTHTKILPNSTLATALPITGYNRNSSTASEDAPNINVPLANGLKTQNLLYDDHLGTPNRSSRRQAPAQVYGLSTPRGNHICLDDGWLDDELTSKNWDDDQTGYQDTETGNPVNDTTIGSRQDEGIVLKTRSGAQILISESKGNIFIINRDGTSRIEMDAEGHITMHAHKSVSIRAKEDLNFIAERDINLEAGRNFTTSVKGYSRTEVHGKYSVLSHSPIVLEGDSTIDINATGELRMKGSSSYLTGANAILLTSSIFTAVSPSITLESSSVLVNSPTITLGGTVVTTGALSASEITGAGGVTLTGHTHNIAGWVNAGSHGNAVVSPTAGGSLPATPPAPDSAPESGDVSIADPVVKATQSDVVELDGDSLVNTSIANDLNVTTSNSLSSVGFVMPATGRVSIYGYWGINVVTPEGGTTTKTGWDVDTSSAVVSAGDGTISAVGTTYIAIEHPNGYMTVYKNITVDDSAFQAGDSVRSGRVIGKATTTLLFEIRKSGASINGFSGTLDPGLFFYEDTGVGSDAAGAVLVSGKNTNTYKSSSSTVPSGSIFVRYTDYDTIASVFPKSGSLFSPISKSTNSSAPVTQSKVAKVKTETATVDKTPINWVVEKTDETVLSDLIEFEGSIAYQTARRYYRNGRFWSYVDSEGYDTIGYGHLIISGEDFSNGITNEEALYILRQDIDIAVSDAKRIANSYKMEIPYAAQVVLTEMAFQLGYSGVAKFTLFLKALANHKYQTASYEMKNSLWYTQAPTRVTELASRIASLG